MSIVARKFVDQAAISTIMTNYNTKVISKILVETNRAKLVEEALRTDINNIDTVQIESNKQAIITINNSDSGILANSKKYTNAEITLVKGLITALESKVNANTSEIGALKTLTSAQGSKIEQLETKVGKETSGDVTGTGIYKRIEDLEVGIGNIDMSGAINQAKTYTDTKITELVGGADQALDTLKELGDALNNDKDALASLTNTVAGKADKKHVHNPSDITGLKIIASTSNYNDLEVKATTSDIPYTNVMYPKFKTLADAMDELLYVQPSINSLKANKSGGTFEIGTTITAPIIFDWTVNKSLSSQSFDGTSLEPTIRTYTYIGADISTNKSFRLLISDGKNSKESSISYSFSHRRYWGAKTPSGTYDSVFIKSLASKEFASSRGKGEFTVVAGPGEYIYYCIPSTWGTPTFNVGGFDGGFDKESTIDFTNESGNTTKFDIWKTKNANLGSCKIKIS